MPQLTKIYKQGKGLPCGDTLIWKEEAWLSGKVAHGTSLFGSKSGWQGGRTLGWNTPGRMTWEAPRPPEKPQWSQCLEG